MQYREIGKTGIQTSILGLGCMRLPILDGDAGKIDYEEASKLVRYAIDHGINYIDTAYPYHQKTSEAFLGQALKDGYRERIHLITKSPIWLIEKHEDFEKYLDEQLENLKTDYVDIYLLHAMNKERWERCKNFDLFSAIESAKQKGKIKNIGFSFHDDLETFKDIASAYPWDICMLQFNYMDVNEQAGIEGLEFAESIGLPLAVMEPLKGGMLAKAPDDVQAIWDQSSEQMTPPEWALRFVANFENVKVILSGMSNMEQLTENLEISNRMLPNSLTPSALETIEQARHVYLEKVQVPCTQCRYCVPCPQDVKIPDIFTLLNRAYMFDVIESSKRYYKKDFSESGAASNCIACGICETKCPQKIEIIESLKRAAALFEV